MPNSIADNLQRLQDAKTAIGNAITAKGGTVSSGDGLEDFATAIGTIPSSSPSVLIEKTITANGTYNASDDSADGYSSVVANVPNTYVAGDEGKVVSSGALVAQTAMSSEITVNDTYDTTLYNSITVNVPPPPSPTPTRTEIVRFMDYDGTILHTYTADEFLELSEMPANPTHTGLTSQGWNWTFEDAKTYVTTNRNLDIGQSYVTDDGRTRIYISLNNPDLLSPTLSLYMLPSTDVDIDWGDGSAHETLSRASSGGTTKNSIQHTYSTTGDYVISFSVTTGTAYISGNSNGSYLISDNKGNPGASSDSGYEITVKKIELGSDIQLSDQAFKSLKVLESVTIPTSIYDFKTFTFQSCFSLKGIVLPKNQSFTIGQNSSIFRECYNLENVSLPKEAYICGYMFYYCYNLKRITIPLGNTKIGVGSSSYSSSSFGNCYSLTDITIPEGITSISGSSFTECDSIKYIKLPSTLTTLDVSVFSNCNSLMEIEFPASVTMVNNYSFSNCYSLKNIKFNNGASSLTIGNSCFQNCKALESVILPSNLASLGNTAFAYCDGLPEIEIPNNVTTMGSECFRGCFALKSVKLGTGITTLPSGCFRDCNILPSIDIPSNVTTISEYCFNGCKSLKTITFHSGLQSLSGSQTFSNCSILESIEFPSTLTTMSSSSNFYGCTSLKTVKFPKTMTTFHPGSLFNNCTLLSEVELPETATVASSNTPGSMFSGCIMLQNIQIPSWVTVIAGYMFQYCYNLTKLTIPDTVTQIQANGLKSMDSLKFLRFISTTPPTAAGTAFSSFPYTCNILVPAYSLPTYKSTSNYPNPSNYNYVGYGTYTSGEALPTETADPTVGLVWYATISDWTSETNPITVGNGDEVYARTVAL